MATLGNARIVRRDRELGAIAPGSSPTSCSSTAIRSGGSTLYEPGAIYRAIGIRP